MARFFHQSKSCTRRVGGLYTYRDVDFSHGVWKVDQPARACNLLRMKAFTKFDERLFVSFSDVALCEEIVRNGYEIHLLSNLNAIRVKHYSTRGRKLKSLFERDMLTYLRLHRGILHYLFAYFFLKLDNLLSKYLDCAKRA